MSDQTSKSRHPTTILVSSGLVIILALLPLYLGQLQTFKDVIDNKARLAGLFVATLAFVIGSWSILNHSGRPKAVGDSDEPAATETWLKAVDLLWKFAAAIAVVVTTNWFAVVLNQEQTTRDKETQRASEKAKADTETVAQAEAAALRVREGVLQLLVNMNDPYVRLLAVTNASGLVSNHRASGFSVSEILFTVALRDPNGEVRAAAERCLPGGILAVEEKYDFSKAVLRLAEKRVSAASSPDRRILDALSAVRQFGPDPDDQSLAEILAAKLGQSQIAAATEANTRFTETEKGQSYPPDKSEQQKVDTFAPAVVLAAANTSNQSEARQATKVLQNTSPDVINAVIQKLPDVVVKKLPSRVYLQIASQDQRAAARLIQAKLIESGYISPGIQNIAGKAYIPDVLEVRYFDPDSKATAENILQVIKSNKSKDGRISYVVPTAEDLRLSADTKSHFEVWAGRNSF